MTKSCTQCQQQFEISDKELALLQELTPIINGNKYPYSIPSECSVCRYQRRVLFRNERSFYKRKCDLCKKDIISTYSPNKPYTVYCSDCWWSDNWDPLSYGIDVDFNKPFYDQLQELKSKVPHLAMRRVSSENSEYTNFANYNKNCYLVTASSYNEDVYYSYWSGYSKDCLDGFHIMNCELCYECIKSERCYNCSFCEYCDDCSDCNFLYNCKNCKNCFLCSNLSNKEYYILNKQYTRDEYLNLIKNYKLFSFNELKNHKDEFAKLKLNTIRNYSNIKNSENCTGDDMVNSKDCTNSYMLEYCENVINCISGHKIKDILDTSLVVLDCQKVYQSCSMLTSNNIASCFDVLTINDSYNCQHCFNSVSNLFGCISVKNKKNYCILNKQYSKEEYERLIVEIIQRLQASNNWGNYFPAELSAFGYNETLANDYYPLGKEEALKKGFKWNDFSQESSYSGMFYTPNDDINFYNNVESSKEILNGVLKCEITGKPFKILPQELAFYLKKQLPLPRRCPERRHLDRISLRNPFKLFDRKCGKCGKDIKTSYAPERKEIVYCDRCYQAEVY